LPNSKRRKSEGIEYPDASDERRMERIQALLDKHRLLPTKRRPTRISGWISRSNALSNGCLGETGFELAY
jgi:hypothetical protein